MSALDDAFENETPAFGSDISPTVPILFPAGADARIPGELVVTLTDAAQANVTPGIPLGPIADADNPPTAFGLADVDAVLAGLGVQAIVRLFGDVAAVPGVDPAVSNFLSATYKVRCDPATDLDQATADLLRWPTSSMQSPTHMSRSQRQFPTILSTSQVRMACGGLGLRALGVLGRSAARESPSPSSTPVSILLIRTWRAGSLEELTYSIRRRLIPAHRFDSLANMGQTLRTTWAMER